MNLITKLICCHQVPAQIEMNLLSPYLEIIENQPLWEKRCSGFANITAPLLPQWRPARHHI